MSVPVSDLKPLLAEVAAGRRLSESDAEAAFEIIMSGDATPSQMGAFLMGLRVRGETVDEITGAARIMRSKALTIDAPTRVELGTRTIFNLLGPLSNPAQTRRQLVGVFAPEWVVPMAEVLGRLGAEHVWVVHGSGMDELTTAGTTKVAEFKNGKVVEFEVEPEDAG